MHRANGGTLLLDVRALLNFGHTFGHAIEAATGYTEWLHGEAVGTGMFIAADFSARIGLLPRTDVDRVRKLLHCYHKATADQWLGVMREAHQQGLRTTATMMYGHVETLEERVEHMRKIRELQDETRGFRAFISWTFQDDGNRVAALVPPETRPTSFDYLLTQAVSRLYLDNVDHIQSSWVTQGMKVGQVALEFGADDLGSIMIEENVVSAAGTTYRASAEDFARTIRALGKTPVQRDTLYRDVKVWN